MTPQASQTNQSQRQAQPRQAQAKNKKKAKPRRRKTSQEEEEEETSQEEEEAKIQMYRIRMYREILPQSESDWGGFLYTFELGLLSCLVLQFGCPKHFMTSIALPPESTQVGG